MASIVGFSQSASKAAPDLGGPDCSCTQGFASCKSVCSLSECCVCWNPNTQTGVCGCYFGIAICRNENNNHPLKLDGEFGKVNAESHNKFAFTNFKKLYRFFEEKAIEHAELAALVNELAEAYHAAEKDAEKIDINNGDYQLILDQYSKVIGGLDDEQKKELTTFIHSL